MILDTYVDGAPPRFGGTLIFVERDARDDWGLSWGVSDASESSPDVRFCGINGCAGVGDGSEDWELLPAIGAGFGLRKENFSGDDSGCFPFPLSGEPKVDMNQVFMHAVMGDYGRTYQDQVCLLG